MNRLVFLFIVAFAHYSLSLGQNCISPNQNELANGINNFRTANGLNTLEISYSLSKLAEQKAESLMNGQQQVTINDNLYNRAQKIIFLKVRSIDANPDNSLPTFTIKHPSMEFWKVILEQESYADNSWQALGTGFYKSYAVIWFTDKKLNDKPQICGGQMVNNQTEIIRPSQKSLPFVKDGKWIVLPTYYQMAFLNFEPDLIPVCNDSEKWGFINKSGEVIIPFQFNRAYGFSEGLAPVMDENEKYGYINANGKFVIPPRYSYAGTFSNGNTIVLDNGKNYVIDKNGNKISEAYSDMDFLSDKYIAYKQGSLYGVKDLSGKVVKAPFFSDFFGYSEGMAGVKVQGKWGFMDENFNLAIKPKYTEKLVYSFFNGYARFRQNGKVGLIDKSGNEILPAQYDDLYEYSDNLMAFSEHRKWGYINLQGQIVIEPQYLSANNFKYGIAIVKDERLRSHLIDIQNNKIVQDVDDINVFSKNLIGINTKGGWGLIWLNK